MGVYGRCVRICTYGCENIVMLWDVWYPSMCGGVVVGEKLLAWLVESRGIP